MRTFTFRTDFSGKFLFKVIKMRAKCCTSMSRSMHLRGCVSVQFKFRGRWTCSLQEFCNRCISDT